MKFKEKISRMIHNAIERYDFEEAIDSVLDDIDIEDIIHSEINARIENVDIEPLLRDLVKGCIEDELDEFDLDGEVLRAIKDQFD